MGRTALIFQNRFRMSALFRNFAAKLLVKGYRRYDSFQEQQDTEPLGEGISHQRTGHYDIYFADVRNVGTGR